MKSPAPIPDALLAKLQALAAIVRSDTDDQRAWDEASEEFDRLMTTAVKVGLVEEVVGLRERVESIEQEQLEHRLRD